MTTVSELVLAAATLAAIATAAHAQTFPTKPVSIIVTSAPGGAADATARMLALISARLWNQQVIVENKPGGNTQIAAEYVAKAAPDGHTLLLGPDVTFTVNPHLYRKLSYDPVKDFEPITGLTVLHQALVTHPSLAGEQRRRSCSRSRRPSRARSTTAPSGSAPPATSTWRRCSRRPA